MGTRMKVFEVVEQTNEGFLRNLVGDVRNAFKPGIAVTPNMIAELEDGLARLQRGEQPTPRQQKMMDTFMSTTLAREVKKTFGVDIAEGRLKSKSYRKSYKAAKASGRRRKKSLRDDIAETATSGGTSAGAIATVSNPSVTRNAKKPKKRKGVAPNALDSGTNLMTGQLLKR